MLSRWLCVPCGCNDIQSYTEIPCLKNYYTYLFIVYAYVCACAVVVVGMWESAAIVFTLGHLCHWTRHFPLVFVVF